jgi:V/A-type H+-transporting ATPase subunit D
MAFPSLGLKTRRTRHELLKLKDQLELAKKAHVLLEEKYKALLQEAQHIRRTLLPFQEKWKFKVEKAYGFLAEAITSLGLLDVYKESLLVEANDDLEIRWTTVQGVPVPRIGSNIRKRTPLERGYEVTNTNYLLDRAARAFEDMLKSLVEVAELDNILRILEGKIEKTGIRVSALEKILIPTLKNQIRIIKRHLDDKERESYVITNWIEEERVE